MKWTIHPIDQLDRFESAWRNLNGSGVDLPVLDPDYVFNLVKYLGTGRELLAVCDGTGGPAAMAVLTLKKPGVWAAFEAGGCPLGIWISGPVTRRWCELLAGLPECGNYARNRELDDGVTEMVDA